MKQCKIFEFVIKQSEWQELIKKQSKAWVNGRKPWIINKTKQDTWINTIREKETWINNRGNKYSKCSNNSQNHHW